MTTEIISSELDVADGEFFRGWKTLSTDVWMFMKKKMRTRVKSGLKGSETVVLEHVKKGLASVEMSERVDQM